MAHDANESQHTGHVSDAASLAASGAPSIKIVSTTWKSIRDAAGGYPQPAFDFVREGLQHTVGLVHGEHALREVISDSDDSRHVSGQQLCFGLKEYAIQRYGRLARTVLSRWNIHQTDDFGRIIFAMIEAGLMRKTDEDRYEDFVGVFDFEDAFEDLEVTRRPAVAAS